MFAAAQSVKYGIMGSVPTRVRFLIYTQILNSFALGHFMMHPSDGGLGSAISSMVWRLSNSDRAIIGSYLLYLGFARVNHILYDVPWPGARAPYLLGIGLLYATFRRIKLGEWG